MFGIDKLGLSFGIGVNYNNYAGIGFEQTLNLSISAGSKGKGSMTAGLGLTSSSSQGLSISPSLSFSKNIQTKEMGDVSLGANIGCSINSRSGLKALTFGGGVNSSLLKDVNSVLGTSGLNGGSSIDFGTTTYTPQITTPMVNTSVTLSIKGGTHFFGLDGTYNVGGYYSEQRSAKSDAQPAYGFLYTGVGSSLSKVMLDFNREKDIPYSINVPSLPVTCFTYDIYSVSGQGVSGTFRPFRNEIGCLFDSRVNNTSDSYTLGVELGGGNLGKGGADVSINDVFTTTGKWEGDNNAVNYLSFKKQSDGNLFEPYYFKEVGEKSVDSDEGFFKKIGGNSPVRISLENGGGMVVRAKNQFIGNGFAEDITSDITRSSRQRRNQSFSFLNLDQTLKFGLQKQYYGPTYNDLVNTKHVGHHIGEVTVVRSDGMRYVYGLPAYNTLQKDVTFNVSERTVDCSTGLVTYVPNEDNTTNNTRGLDNYYSCTTLPPFAHAYFLTAVVSSDYSDLNEDGPSDEDLGTYTIFKYKKISGYRWRVPFEVNKANYNQGLRSLPEDDQGNYIYGEKELYYLDTIITRNYIAVFHTDNRDDGYGVADENGGKGNLTMQKLNQIDLYSKPEFYNNPGGAIPIKSVHFRYSYKLCQGVPNNITGGGKLTLDSVYFTYGNTTKGALSAYKFSYPNTAERNPVYNLKGYDRWGNYKPNSTNTSCDAQTPITTSEYPYVEQNDPAKAGKYASAWTVDTIELPSGGKINITYESDDYAYVQNLRAGQMFKVTSIGSTGAASESPNDPQKNMLMENHSGVPGSNEGNNQYLYFKLQSDFNATGNDAKMKLKNEYIGADDLIYFKFLVNLTGTNKKSFDYVPGYAKIDDEDYGVRKVGSEYYGWVKLNTVDIGDKRWNADVNPISKAAWQFGRLHAQRLVFNQPDPQGSGIKNIIIALVNSSFVKTLSEFISGVNRTIRDQDFGKEVILAKSWIRLLNPTMKKLGGGCRVSKIVIDDRWNTMVTGEERLETGQEYDYTTQLDLGNGNYRTISSGVASYEPSIGNDENFFHQPLYVSEDKKEEALLAPDDEHYMESPMGESFFPSPSVGYSKVTIKNLQRFNNDTQQKIVKKHATGSVVHEFFTAKDFPTIYDQTDIDPRPKKTDPIVKLFKVTVKDFMTVSQGYAVELNDMHGKPKAQWVFAEDQPKPISGVEYKYQTSGARLNNKVRVVSIEGKLDSTTVGVDFDCVVDMREQLTTSDSYGLSGNVAGFLAGIFPIVVPTILPSYSKEKTRFRSAVVTKVINRSGILVETVVHDQSSVISTENLAYDKETGEVLLTKTKNEFKEPVFSFTYPAHWAYNGMGQAYKNNGYQKTFNIGTNGDGVFTAGDAVIVKKGASEMLGWVLQTDAAHTYIIDKNGAKITGSGTATIIRSGRRNQQALPIGKLVSRKDPFVGSPEAKIIMTSSQALPVGILDADMTTYSDTMQMFCGKVYLYNKDTCICDSLTQEAKDLLGLLNRLSSRSSLVSYTELSPNINYFPTYFTPTLAEYFQDDSPVMWNGRQSGNNFIGDIFSSYDSTDKCSITLSNFYINPVATLRYKFSDIKPAFDSANCDSVYGFTVKASTDNGTSWITVRGKTTCWPIVNCRKELGPSQTQCGAIKGDLINPYFYGLRGNWRLNKNNKYVVNRTPEFTVNTADIRTAGEYKEFTPAWFRTNAQGSPFIDYTVNDKRWVWTSEVTKYNTLGFEVENRDALNRFSSALYGYNYALPIAVASNARYKQIAYDGFEDYNFLAKTCADYHFNYFNDRFRRTTWTAHSGSYSMLITKNYPVSLTRLINANATQLPTIEFPENHLKDTNCLGIFSPDSAKQYILGAWVKEDAPPTTISYQNVNIKVEITNGSPSNFLFRPKGIIIDGWQRIDTTFRISGNASKIKVTLDAGDAIFTYVDDIRIHPFEGNLKSYVYDPVTLRLMAVLDENNYATFYEYDEEGLLIRTKKETERGIVLIQEARSHTSTH